MSVGLESNGLLGGMEFPAEPNDGLVNNGLLSGLQEDDGLQSNGLLSMMEDDQMLLDIESGVGSLAGSKGGETGFSGVGQSEEGIGSSVPSRYGADSRLSTPLDIDTDTYISSNSNLAGPSKQRVSHQHVYRDDTALRNAQALSLPRMFASTADGKYVSFGRKVRRKWDGVAVSHRQQLDNQDISQLTVFRRPKSRPDPYLKATKTVDSSSSTFPTTSS
jgi:hypothetical protein